MDGVLYSGNKALPNSFESLNELEKLGKQIVFFTNNSTKSRENNMKNLIRLGYKAKTE